ncbi:ABC transporter substrate-binding protein [Tepidibacillus fermentans]|uniref:Peptide/nickel transport system substrate-binding protein n=1 Tax=Tepidibacillus fermentans TaxID=1281767 RepID=A0A4R3KHX6_9BACI|nr:ABC transporter substrate-binding protein [Tepidibacillus fermentans]TCS83077.1 peptide/nickel transport system substrate-binding protein [Tepidibacillus fermentans]
MKKGLSLFLAILFLLSIALTGCGGSKETATSNGDQGKSNTNVQSTLVFGRGGDSVSLDPANVTDGESLNVTQNIFDTLVAYKEGNTEIEPALAEKWETSADGLTWTFHLRQGVKFHDGTDFNADAVVFNFNRWMDKKNPYHKGDFPYYGYMFGGYKGDKGHVIKNVVAKDPYTVEIQLNVPQGPFLNNLAMPAFAIASPEAIKKYGEKFGENPVGTGPFVFKQWIRNDKIILDKNPNYWLKGYPLLSQLIFKSIPDNQARFTALQSGDIDMMDGVNPDDVTLAKKNPALQVWLRPSMNVGYLAFNTQKPPFNNVKVRQALNMAVNKQALIDAFYNGLAEPAKNPIPPSLWGYNDAIQDYSYNIEEAKKLLTEAGYPNGFTTDLWYMPVPRPYIPQGKKIAEAIQTEFEKIGVKTNLVTEEWATYLDKTGKGEHTMALFGWTGDNGDPDNFLYVLLDKDNAKAPDAGNISFYKNDKLHEILIKAQRSSDQNERTELYKQAQEIIHNDAPWIPLVHSTPPLVGKKNIVGFNPHPTGTDKFTKVHFE